MTPSERDKRFHAAQRAVVLRRTAIQRDTAGAINGLLRDSLQRIRTTLAGQPSDYQRWALPPLEQQVRRTLEATAGEMTATLHAGAERSFAAGQAMIDEPLAAAGVDIAGVAQRLDRRQLEGMQTFMTGRIRDITLTTANRINTELGLVITGVQAPGDAVTVISRLLGDQARGRAVTIVRTELGRAFNSANHARALQARERVPGLKKQWRRSGKLHSRPAHDVADGQVREVDEPFQVGGHELMFPNDPAAPASETINCGCVSLNYMESWEMSTPGRRPFTPRELAVSPFRRDLTQSLAASRPPDAAAVLRALVPIGEVAPETTTAVAQALEAMPESVQRKVIGSGREVVVGLSLVAVEPRLAGQQAPGHPEGITWDNLDGVTTSNRVIVGERYVEHATGREVTNPDPAGTLRHEFGHAFDSSYEPRLSEDLEYMHAWLAEAKALAPRASLDTDAKYLIQSATGPEETFVEIFAALTGGGMVAGLDVTAEFPRVTAIVRTMINSPP